LGPWEVIESENKLFQDRISIRDSATRIVAHIRHYLYRLSNLGFSREVKHLARAYSPESDLLGPSIAMFDNAVVEAVNLDVDFSDLDLGILPHPLFLSFFRL
jgi:hypothetical protein